MRGQNGDNKGGIHMGLSDYLIKDGKLTHMLKLEDTQGALLDLLGVPGSLSPQASGAPNLLVLLKW
jgi:hypothetical protein